MPDRVLVVDDDPVIVRLLEVNLRLEGFEVSSASRGEEALAMIDEDPPDLVVLDVMMPGLDGWATYRRLRERPERGDLPVVFLSARTQDEERGKGIGPGPVRYVTKPFDPVRLMETVREMLGAADATGEVESEGEASS